LEKRTYTFNHSVDVSLEAACTQYLTDIGITKDAVKFTAEKFKTEMKWFSNENLERQTKRLQKGEKTGISFPILLKIQADIEDIKKVLQEA
jgi:hypothetical protein